MDDLLSAITLITALVVGLILPVLGFVWKIIVEWDKVPAGFKTWFARREESTPGPLRSLLKFAFGRAFAWFLVLLFAAATIFLLTHRSSTVVSVPENYLIDYHDFEDRGHGWSDFQCVQYDMDGSQLSKFPGGAFPGSLTADLSDDMALTGRRSLKASTNVNSKGIYQSRISWSGSFIANGVNIYVRQPDAFGDLDIDYLWVQLCIIPDGAPWVCSEKVYPLKNEWTPVTIDLTGRFDQYERSYAKQRLSGMAVLWEFRAADDTLVKLHLDSGEVFRPGQ